MGKKHRFFGACVLVFAFLWIGVIVLLCLQSGADSQSLSRMLAKKLFVFFEKDGLDLLAFEKILRKAAHFGVFAVEGFLLCAAVRMLSGRWRTLAVLLFMGFAAVGAECCELLAQGRGFLPMDMLINFSGAVFGAAVCRGVGCVAAMLNKR